MTISEALKSINPYPIPSNVVEKICVERGLVSSTTYDSSVSVSDSYRLAEADIYMWLYNSPTLKEQEVSFSINDKNNFREIANSVYLELDDPKYMGNTYGFVGESYNG